MPGVRVRLIATCPEETKPALLHELAALGATDLVPGFRAVSFEMRKQRLRRAFHKGRMRAVRPLLVS